MKWAQNMIWPSLPCTCGGTLLYSGSCFSSSLCFCLIDKLWQWLSCKGAEGPCKCPHLLAGQVGLFRHPELLSTALVSRGGESRKEQVQGGRRTKHSPETCQHESRSEKKWSQYDLNATLQGIKQCAKRHHIYIFFNPICITQTVKHSD